MLRRLLNSLGNTLGDTLGNLGPPEIPLRIELRTSAKALSILSGRIGPKMTAEVALELVWAQLRGFPFQHMGPPVDRREALSRRQAGPAILLYRALEGRLGRERALELTGEVAIAGAVIFLGHSVGPIDRAGLLGLSESAREERVQSIGARFFNATARWDEISSEQVQFTVTHCAFPALCLAAGAPEVAPLLCAGDAVYFGEVLGTVDLERPHTIAGGASACPFTLRWKEV